MLLTWESKLVLIVFLSFPKNREELTETRESLQQMKEKLVGQEESFRKKCIDLDADVLSLRKANAELEVMTRAGHSYCSCDKCLNLNSVTVKEEVESNNFFLFEQWFLRFKNFLCFSVKYTQ